MKITIDKNIATIDDKQYPIKDGSIDLNHPIETDEAVKKHDEDRAAYIQQMFAERDDIRKLMDKTKSDVVRYS